MTIPDIEIMHGCYYFCLILREAVMRSGLEGGTAVIELNWDFELMSYDE